MKLELETLPNCKTRIAVEVPSDQVQKEKESILKNYQKFARFPGFRPGKAPRSVVEKKYGKDIQDELVRALVGDAARTAIKEHSLKVLSVAKVEEPVTRDDQSLTFEVEVITEPEFELPNYKGLPLETQPVTVTDDEINKILDNARHRLADYPEVTDRPCQLEDYVVLDYFATLDGQPLDVAVPDAPERIVKDTHSWLRLVDDAFLPGFAQAIAGMQKEETREVDLPIAGDFAIDALRDKSLHYSVTLKEIHTLQLPELDDAFASKVAKGKTLAELRELIAENIREDKERTNVQQKQNHAVRQLVEAVDFELPESVLKNEARRALTNIVEENQSRGVSDEELKEHHDEIMQGAQKSAKDRLKSTYLLLRIANEEKLEVSDRELNDYIHLMAIRYRTPEAKFRKDLEKRNATDAIREEILAGKALDFVISHATITESAPAPSVEA